MKANEIKAIETEYNGYRFRSRLEARWAVFFDTLGIRYEYEPEGYVLSDGNRYLPDFFLPDFKYYAEVKGMSDHILDDISKLKHFVLEAKTAVIILSDIPYDPDAKGLFWFPVLTFSARSRGCIDGFRASFFKIKKDPDLADNFYTGRRSFVTLQTEPIFKNDTRDKLAKRVFKKIQAVSGAKLDDDKGTSIKELFENELLPVEMALKTARQARFEHGETPAPAHSEADL